MPISRADLDEKKLETEQKYQHHLKKKTVRIIIINSQFAGLTDVSSTLMSTILLLPVLDNVFYLSLITLTTFLSVLSGLTSKNCAAIFLAVSGKLHFDSKCEG